MDKPVKPTYNDNIGLPDIHYNPLLNYRSTTYNTRLTMMPKYDATVSRHDRSYDYKKGIVMWETGGVGSVVLEELIMDGSGTGNKTGNYLTVDPLGFKGRLVEPLGGRFVEALSLAAMQLEYKNNQDAIYLLEISFVGFDENDLPIICRDWNNNEMVFRWYVSLNQLKMKLDYKGTIYDFDLKLSDGNALLNDFTKLEKGVKPDGQPNTIGDFCRNLSAALNKNEAEKVKAKIRCVPHKYVITAHKEITNLKLSYGIWSRLAHAFSMNREMQVTPGTTIQDLIVASMPNSEELLAWLHRAPEKRDYNSPDTKPNKAEYPLRHIAIIPGCKDIEFDPKLGGTAREVHYFITTKEDAKTIISPQEYVDAQDPVQRNKRVDNWIKKGLLRKVYKWIYTGENTEVLNADITFDHLWRNVRPLWIDKDGKPLAAMSSAATAAETSSAKSKSKPITCEDAKKVLAARNLDKIYYAEDMPFKSGTSIAPKAGWYPHMPQFYHMNTTVDQTSTQTTLYQESAQEYSIYRQVSNNMAAGNSDLVTMELEVVGDPYWLFQIPTKAGEAPWTDDVWEYEKEQLTENQMAEKRKSTSTNTWLGFVYFEAQIPSADISSTDMMALREADAISGVFVVKKAVNKFSKGKFTTHLSMYRESLANPWTGKHSPVDAAEKTKAYSAGPNNAAPQGAPNPEDSHFNAANTAGGAAVGNGAIADSTRLGNPNIRKGSLRERAAQANAAAAAAAAEKVKNASAK